jgi:tetratricopeptide (TPR) repeat protein
VRLKAALELLDRKDDVAAWSSARHIAEGLVEAEYRDPNFPGASEYIAGMVAVRTPGDDRERSLASAVKLLREADQFGLDGGRRMEWAFTLGISLFELGRRDEARPLLEEVWWNYEPGKTAAGLALAEMALDGGHDRAIVRPEQVIAELRAKPGLSAADLRRLAMIQARAALRDGRAADAEAALAGLSPQDAADDDAVLLKAETLLAADRLDEARRLLLPLTRAQSREMIPARKAAASFLLGRCDERRGDPAAATLAFERAADLAPESPDGIAAAFAAGRLLQAAERDEEALVLYRRAIASQGSREPAPLPEDQARESVRAGCAAWLARGAFERAAELAAAGEPILGRIESVRLLARCREQAARSVESASEAMPVARREAAEAGRREAWRQSGAAYRELAAVVIESAEVSEALWTAADHFKRGHAFKDAEQVYSDLLELRLSTSEAAALAGRGRVRLDLARPADAATDFRAILDRHPTDPEVFNARLLLGRCHLELGDAARAESAWRELLSLGELSPRAAEWRAALYALAELLYRRGAAAAGEAERKADPGGEADKKAVLALDEAIVRLGEYVRRVPDAAEARILRADALHRRAGIALRRAAVAETENLRAADRGEAEKLLVEAVGELRAAQEKLAPRSDAESLSRLDRELFKTTFFELGNTYAALGRDREAVVALGAAVNRYPDDARVIGAYVRMAECYRRLGRPDEARAAVEQGRLFLDHLPAASFTNGATVLTKDEWSAWLTRAREIDAPPAPP